MLDALPGQTLGLAQLLNYVDRALEATSRGFESAPTDPIPAPLQAPPSPPTLLPLPTPPKPPPPPSSKSSSNPKTMTIGDCDSPNQSLSQSAIDDPWLGLAHRFPIAALPSARAFIAQAMRRGGAGDTGAA